MIAVTRNPTAEWLAGQITEAFPWNSAPKYLIRDNDALRVPEGILVSCLWHWGGFSGECLVQPQDMLVGQAAQPACIDIKASGRPKAIKGDALVASEIEGGRVDQVRAKLTDDQRRNLRITALGPVFKRWR